MAYSGYAAAFTLPACVCGKQTAVSQMDQHTPRLMLGHLRQFGRARPTHAASPKNQRVALLSIYGTAVDSRNKFRSRPRSSPKRIGNQSSQRNISISTAQIPSAQITQHFVQELLLYTRTCFFPYCVVYYGLDGYKPLTHEQKGCFMHEKNQWVSPRNGR